MAFESWRVGDAENNQRLRERISQGRADHKLSMKGLGADCDIPNLSHWFNNSPKYSKLPNHQYATLVLHGITNGWLGSDDETYYKEFSSFLGHNLDELPRTRLERHYVVHRLSFLAQGFVLRGFLTIRRDEGSLSIRTEEFHCIQASVAKEVGLGDHDFEFPRSGHLFSRKGNEYLMISRKDTYRDQIQTSYLQAHGDLDTLRGPFSDWHGGDHYHAYMVAGALPDQRNPAGTPEDWWDRKGAQAMRPHEIDSGILRILKENQKSNMLELNAEVGVTLAGDSVGKATMGDSNVRKRIAKKRRRMAKRQQR